MKTWEEAFKPVMKARGWDIRPGQALLGDAVLEALENHTNVAALAPVATGKSMVAIVPAVLAIQEAKAKNRAFRAVVSTGTITLQDQIIKKDLPDIKSIYGGFSYKKLMGRGRYLCLEHLKAESVGRDETNALYNKLQTRIDNLGDGEMADVERVLARRVTNEEWSRMCGSTEFCGDNQCDAGNCFGTKARNEALKADLVVCNHALLAAHLDSKLSAVEGEGILGIIDFLVVDEAHELPQVLTDAWTHTLSEYELTNFSGNIMSGFQWAQEKVRTDKNLAIATEFSLGELEKSILAIKKFYMLLAEDKGIKWSDSSTALALQYVRKTDAEINSLMNEFEVNLPLVLESCQTTFAKTLKFLTQAKISADERNLKGRRKLNKGYRAIKELTEIIDIIQKAIVTKDGIISSFGTDYGVRMDGWTNHKGEDKFTLYMTPLGVSKKASEIWADIPTNLIMSGTLEDLTDGSLRYAKDSIGFPPCKEIRVPAAFDYSQQQLVYITKAQHERVSDTSWYSFHELVALLEASGGRALVLFTSRRELEQAAEKLRELSIQGKFHHRLLVQEKDSDKQELAQLFKKDTSSVLLGLRSFFTGFDVPGESLSLLVLCRFPLPRYSVECKQQIAYWRMRGFPKWYEREALTVFQQGAGRLIRSASDKGVVALLDQRAMDSKSNVYSTMSLGVQSLGSYVVQDIDTVKNFLA